MVEKGRQGAAEFRTVVRRLYDGYRTTLIATPELSRLHVDSMLGHPQYSTVIEEEGFDTEKNRVVFHRPNAAYRVGSPEGNDLPNWEFTTRSLVLDRFPKIEGVIVPSDQECLELGIRTKLERSDENPDGSFDLEEGEVIGTRVIYKDFRQPRETRDVFGEDALAKGEDLLSRLKSGE